MSKKKAKMDAVKGNKSLTTETVEMKLKKISKGKKNNEEESFEKRTKEER